MHTYNSIIHILLHIIFWCVPYQPQVLIIISANNKLISVPSLLPSLNTSSLSIENYIDLSKRKLSYPEMHNCTKNGDGLSVENINVSIFKLNK